jgi:hypothetical protein
MLMLRHFTLSDTMQMEFLSGDSDYSAMASRPDRRA